MAVSKFYALVKTKDGRKRVVNAFEAIKKFSGHSDEKGSEISAEKLEPLAIARLAFFANLREDIEF